MNICGNLSVQRGSWPNRVRMSVYMNEGTRTGQVLSGDVKIVARKGSNPRVNQALGMNGTDLIVHVQNGRWYNPQPWDYRYWANKGFDSLAAIYTDPDGKYHEWVWNSDPAKNREATQPVPTSISKIHHTCVVDDRNPKLMRYALTWTILDQFGKPIDGSVTSVFDGATNDVHSKLDRKGVCFDTAQVEGYGKEMFYTILPPTGEPQILKLVGPTKAVEDEGIKVAATERFKLGVEGEVIKARAFRAVIPYQTFDKYGKAYASKVEATIVQGGNTTFINARTNAVLVEKTCYCETTTDPDGSYRLQVEFKGRMRITAELFHSDSNQRRKIELVYSQY